VRATYITQADIEKEGTLKISGGTALINPNRRVIAIAETLGS
jgi:hypothetical protein